jgi:hypothetical protein
MTTYSKDVPLNTTPHYTNPLFRTPQTVFGRERKGLHYDYSDRLWEWDWNKASAASDAATTSGARLKTAAWYEAFLSAYYARPVVVHHILAGYNLATGYPYAVFGYTFADAEPSAEVQP